ncbi:MAG TPA: hypothetical protein VL918_02885, partial [Sphingobium sp.]|nr:hypothetical protein [Sphingobium sp.]
NTPVCSPGGGITPGGTNVDRRRIPMAIVNCTANNVGPSSSNVPVERWVDVFLVEPSISRNGPGGSYSNAQDVYVEVIEESGTNAGGATAGQVVQRNVPYLVR